MWSPPDTQSPLYMRPPQPTVDIVPTSDEGQSPEDSPLLLYLLALLFFIGLATCVVFLVLFYRSGEGDAPTGSFVTPAGSPGRKASTVSSARTRGTDSAQPDNYPDVDYTDAETGTPSSRITTASKGQTPGACGTPDCSNVASLYARSVRSSADPCQSFYAYVCGGSSVNVMDEMQRVMREGIEREFSKITVPASQQSASQKAKAFYDSCMVRHTQTTNNIAILNSFFRQNDLSFQPDNDITDPLNTTVRLLLRYDIDVFFYFDIVNTITKNDRFAFIVSESPKLIGWTSDATKFRSDSDYSAYAAQVLAPFGIAATQDVASTVRSIRSVENGIFATRRENRNTTVISSELVWFIANWVVQVKWREYLSKYTGIVVNKWYYAVYKTEISYFVNVLFARPDKMPPEEVNLYITWAVARYLVDVSGLRRDPAQNDKQWCNERTLSSYKHAVVSPYFMSLVNESKVDSVTSMVTDIRGAIADKMQKSDWLEEPTKTALLSKLTAIRFQVGYPEGLRALRDVDAYYTSSPEVTGPFLKFFLNTSEGRAQRFAALMETIPADILLLDFDYLASNVYYDHRSNVVYIPAATMLSPEYNYGAPPAINYGPLGSAVAHAIMNAFDTSNRFTDKDSSQLQWTPRSEAGFQMRSRCHEESIKTVPTAKRTLKDEYLADFMASRSLYGAYSAARATSSQKITGLESFEDDQLFFIGRCFLFCAGNAPPAPGASPPSAHRCNVPAAHSHRFASAFKCARGSAMNPAKKCSFW